VNLRCAASEGPDQWVGRSDRDGDVEAALEFEQRQSVVRRALCVDIAADGSDAHQIDVGLTQQVGKRQGVIDSGVAVQEEPNGHRGLRSFEIESTVRV
jgi:hypothetical protein